MKKKIFILTLVFAILTLAIFLSSCGGTDGLEFIDINEDECGVKCGEAVNESEIVIPSKHDGKKVTTIMSSGFYKCENLVSITIPKTVTSIERGAFYDCKNLENVYYKGKVKNWCKIDFAHSSSNPMSEAENFFAKSKKITELKISDIEVIKPYTFFGFDNLTSVKFDDALKSIGENAFAGCKNLSSVTFPSSLEKLDKLCFSNCTSLTEITLPANFYQLHVLAFYESKVQTVTFENTEKWFFTSKDTATKGDKVDVTDSTKNAKELKKSLSGYWKRVLPTT